MNASAVFTYPRGPLCVSDRPCRPVQLFDVDEPAAKFAREIDQLLYHQEIYEEARLAFDALMHPIERGYVDFSE